MTIFSNMRRFIVAGAALCSIGFLVAGCNEAVLPPQHAEFGCPVNNPDEFKASLNGEFGGDGMGRPLNSHNMPIDANGNCLTEYPVAADAVYALPPLPQAYYPVYQHYYGYAYVYHPGVIVVYRPGVVIRSGPPPMTSTSVRTITYSGPKLAAPVKTVTVPAGPAAPMQSARPGASNPGSTVTAPGGTMQTAKPGAPAPSVAAPSQSVAPPKASPDTATPGLSRPQSATPSPSVAAPSQSVAPPKAAPSTATPGLSRPAPSAPAPTQSIAPPRAAPSTSSPGLSRPSGGGFSGGRSGGRR